MKDFNRRRFYIKNIKQTKKKQIAWYILPQFHSARLNEASIKYRNFLKCEVYAFKLFNE